jgi:hypothetical protein
MEFSQHLVLLKNAFSKNDIIELKRLAEEFAGDAFLHYREENVGLSIVAYSCAKFLEKPYVVENPAWASFRKSLLKLLDDSIRDFNAGNQEKGLARMRKSVVLIGELGQKLGRFALGIVEKARLKVGAEVYAHGASLGIASSLSGSEKKELSAYISATKMPEKYVTKSVSQRLADARKVFS